MIEGTTKMLRCKACAIPVPNSKERRSLESSSSEHVKLALEASFREDGRCAVATRLHVSTGYVCKKCFLLVDKKVRIKNELEKVKVNLKDKVSRGIESFALPVSTEELIETPLTVQSAVKRTSASAAVPAPKRPRMNEPMQEQSASVTVS